MSANFRLGTKQLKAYVCWVHVGLVATVGERSSVMVSLLAGYLLFVSVFVISDPPGPGLRVRPARASLGPAYRTVYLLATVGTKVRYTYCGLLHSITNHDSQFMGERGRLHCCRLSEQVPLMEGKSPIQSLSKWQDWEENSVVVQQPEKGAWRKLEL